MHCKPFDSYIAECAEQIKQKRTAAQYHIDEKQVISANSPFESRPPLPVGAAKFPYGALLIHGLLDSPFTCHDIAAQLKEAGILSRAVLLPGHGTVPTDLMNVNYQDWIDTVRYGVDSLRNEVEHIFLIGYSTGATLSIYHALHDSKIKGIVLLAPALKILPPTSTVVRLPTLANFFSQEDKWICQEVENDYAKYQSVPFHPVLELGKLINMINQMKQRLTCPAMLTMSINDETVSARAALRYFNNKTNDKSRAIIYATHDKLSNNPRFTVRQSAYPALHIKQMSHIALPFAPNNAHYGQDGDYLDHSNPEAKHIIYGAYNRLETRFYDQLYKAKIVKNRRSTLTYNPDFAYMAKSIVEFIKS